MDKYICYYLRLGSGDESAAGEMIILSLFSVCFSNDPDNQWCRNGGHNPGLPHGARRPWGSFFGRPQRRFFPRLLYSSSAFPKNSGVLYRTRRSKKSPPLAVEETPLAVGLAGCAGDDHGQAQGVSPVDDLPVPDGAEGIDDGGDPVCGRQLHDIREW